MPGICGLIAAESQSVLVHITLRFGASGAPLQVITHTHTPRVDRTQAAVPPQSTAQISGYTIHKSTRKGTAK